MESFEGETRYAEYDEFSLADEARSYTLYVAGFFDSSTAGTCVAIPSFSSAVLQYMCVLSCRFPFAPLAGHLIRKGRIFNSYSKFRIFERFPAIRFDIRRFAAINEYCSNKFLQILSRKSVPFDFYFLT